MPMDSVSKENEKLMKIHGEKEPQLNEETTSIEQMWLKELSDLKRNYK